MMEAKKEHFEGDPLAASYRELAGILVKASERVLPGAYALVTFYNEAGDSSGTCGNDPDRKRAADVATQVARKLADPSTVLSEKP